MILYNIKTKKLYLVDFISDSEKVDIRFFSKNKEMKITTEMESIDVSIKNTTYDRYFDCNVIINIGKMKFTLSTDFDWTLQEMKLLFEYIKSAKNQELNFKELFILRQIDKKIKNN